MEQPPPYLLKSIADRLATATISPEGREILHLLMLSGILVDNQSLGATSSFSFKTPHSSRVGIWERTNAAVDPRFIRAQDAIGEWHMWANRGVIGPKRTQFRVVFIGESVARGWFYQPHYAPADVLQTILQSCLGLSVEVVDLARTDLQYEVRELALDAAVLEPDVVVIFSGNNWRPSMSLDAATLARYEGALQQNGVVALKAMFEDQLYAKATSIIEEVSAYYRARSIPVLWIVPEFNLVDWRDWRVNAPFLAPSGNAAWIESALRAEQALTNGDYLVADAMARHMSELDGGTGTFPLRIRADCALRRVDASNARRLLEAARDARIWDLSQPISPRPYSVTQNAIRVAADASQCSVVDLPRIFGQYLPDQLPDRRLFADYCHLTDEGIRVSMAAVAAQLAKILVRKHVDVPSILPRAPIAERRVKAEAFFLAAIYNAHWNQPADIVLYQCAAALRESDHVRKVMEYFVDLQRTPGPTLLGKAAEQIAAETGETIQNYILRIGSPVLDHVLITCIAEALAQVGVDISSRVAENWRSVHSAVNAPQDLLSYYYLSSSGQPQELVWTFPPEFEAPYASADYYKAYWIESKFVFIAEFNRALRFRITMRVPADSDNGEVMVFVNGRKMKCLGAGKTWAFHEVEIPPEMVVDGVNNIVFRWPLRTVAHQEKAVSATIALMMGYKDHLFDVFGEIHRLTIQLA